MYLIYFDEVKNDGDTQKYYWVSGIALDAANLSGWRSFGTEYQLGRSIEHLIDTVHFTESHLSRLLQLADVHIWCRQFRSLNQKPSKEVAKLMIQEIGGTGDALFAHTYKEYPYGY